MDVELDVVDRNNKPPLWDKNVYSPIYIRENVTVSTVVHSVKARFVQLPPMVPNVSFLSYLLHYSILRYRYRTATVIIQQLWAFTTNSIFSANETIFLPFVTNFWCLCFKIYLLFLSLQIFDFWISFWISELLFVQELRLNPRFYSVLSILSSLSLTLLFITLFLVLCFNSKNLATPPMKWLLIRIQ